MKPILEVHGVSKKFLIQHQKLPYLSFRDMLASAFQSKSKNEEFWALQSISFSVHPGESLGIIGRNGAGKSTLLKILSRITPPTEGRIIVRGRIASLLEVGTGFHQELTGRENVFMNGSILGMRNAEIKRRFDAIIDFSGVEKFLDTPLKHYSSGMQLRLAFAVAAHLEPEILIVDEVLAVGDSEFQKKCLKKMEDVTGQGRTVLFVSHNLPSLKAICEGGLLLREGKIAKRGTIEKVIDYYTADEQTSDLIIESIHYYQDHIRVNKVTINESDRNSLLLKEERTLRIHLDISFIKRTPFELDVHLKHHELTVASYANFVKSDVHVFDKGTYLLDYMIELPFMRSGVYKLDLFFTEPFVSWFAVTENAINVEVLNSDYHTFLNTPSLKWGSVLMKGNYISKTL